MPQLEDVKFDKKCRTRRGTNSTINYTPNDNAAKGQWPESKFALANKPLKTTAHMAMCLGKAVRAGGVRPVAAHKYARVATARPSRAMAARVAARVAAAHKHFPHADVLPPGRRVRIPTAYDIRREEEMARLIPDMRAALPR